MVSIDEKAKRLDEKRSKLPKTALRFLREEIVACVNSELDDPSRGVENLPFYEKIRIIEQAYKFCFGDNSTYSLA